MKRFRSTLAASAMLLCGTGASHALTLSDFGLTKYTVPVDFLYTAATYAGFTSTLTSLLTSVAALTDFKAAITGAGTSLVVGSAGPTAWSSAITFEGLTVKLTGFSFTVANEATPVSDVIAAPGPIVAAGLPAARPDGLRRLAPPLRHRHGRRLTRPRSFDWHPLNPALAAGFFAFGASSGARGVRHASTPATTGDGPNGMPRQDLMCMKVAYNRDTTSIQIARRQSADAVPRTAKSPGLPGLSAT